jgi:hypothetical protein
MNRAAWDSLVTAARAVDLVELARSYGAELRRQGHEHVGPCPVCGGRDRFAINVAKQKFNCRGCGRGGAGPIDLQMFVVGGDFVDAVKTLTGTASLTGLRRPTSSKTNDDHANYEAEQRRKAAWLWQQSTLIGGTPAERYLHDARSISCPLPTMLRFLPPRGEHPPALIAPFVIPNEPEPGELALPTKVDAVHLIKLAADGSDRLRQDKGKITVGRPRGRPIVVAPVNDLLGLAVTEGIEDALAVHEATGLGAWAAASAVFMPTVAAVVPDYVTAITIFAHADSAGQDGARALVAALRCRDLEIRTEGLS